jgi:hypothetical protein
MTFKGPNFKLILIFGHVRPFYERAVNDPDRSMHRALWVYVAHSSFIEGSHMTKNMASVQFYPRPILQLHN